MYRPDLEFRFELTEDYTSVPETEETCPRTWYVRGAKGAVQFTAARVSPDLEEEFKKRMPNSDLFSVDRDGHLWMGLDLGYHTRTERGRDCHIIGEWCRFAVGSFAEAQAICRKWVESDFDDYVLRDILTDEYEDTVG